MTAHGKDPSAHAGSPRAVPGVIGGTPTTAVRPRWLMPGLLVVIGAAGLVVAGVLSLSTVLYAGLFGGMILMHLGGHGGHGAHGGGGGGHGGHEDDPTNDAEDLSARPSGPQAPGSVVKGELEAWASTDRRGSETVNHDEHRSHGCH